MITDMKTRGMVGTGWRPPCRLLLLPVLVLSAWLGGCDKVPLTAPSGTTIRLYTNAQVLPVNGAAQITASVLESGGWPVQNGTVVTFTASLGSVTPAEATTTDGKVTVSFNAGSQSGTAVINAFSGSASTTGATGGTGGTAGGTTGTVGSGVSILIGAAAATTVVATASPSSVSQLGGTALITASVLDANNNGLSGVPVAFSTDQGTLSPVTGITNASGVATTTLNTNQTATVTITAGTKTATAKVTAVAVPTVTVSGPSTLPTVGVTANFTVNATAGSGSAPIRSVIIDFGDGQSASLGAAAGSVSVPHVYTKTGTFTVTAVATDASGQSTSASVPVVVFGPVAFQVTLTAPSGKSGVSVTLTAVVAAGSPAIDRYEWSFGDGKEAVTTDATVPHIYTLNAGTTVPVQFIATVKAIGNDGRFGVGSATVTIVP
jgi:large repetitive protein